MSSAPSPDLMNSAHRRKFQMLVFGGGLMLAALVAYMAGGSGDQPDHAQVRADPIPIQPPPVDPRGDSLFPDLLPDEGFVEPPEPVPSPEVASNSRPGLPAAQHHDLHQAQPEPVVQTGTGRPGLSVPGTDLAGGPQETSSKGTVEKVRSPVPRGLPEAERLPAAGERRESKQMTSSGERRSLGLALKRPAKSLPAIVAHTDGVVTEREFNGPSNSGTPDAGAPPPAKPRIVKVTKPQAQAFADESTKTWLEEGRIPAAQRFRLPRVRETSTTSIWREEDAPAKPGERKAFALVLVDEPRTGALAKAEEITLTPEGIPVRNVPEGVSALKKNGPDKPLWTRPE